MLYKSHYRKTNQTNHFVEDLIKFMYFACNVCFTVHILQPYVYICTKYMCGNFIYLACCFDLNLLKKYSIVVYLHAVNIVCTWNRFLSAPQTMQNLRYFCVNFASVLHGAIKLSQPTWIFTRAHNRSTGGVKLKIFQTKLSGVTSCRFIRP